MNDAQLTLDGRTVEHPLPAKQSRTPLTVAQRAILREIGEKGEVRSVDAGVIVHQCRKDAGVAAAHGRLETWLAGQRKYAAADGLAALNRLAERGFVRRVKPGVWVAV